MDKFWEFVNLIQPQIKNLRDYLSKLSTWSSAKKGVIGEIQPYTKHEPLSVEPQDLPPSKDTPKIDLANLDKISHKKIISMIALFLILLAGSSVLLWKKLTMPSNGYTPTELAEVSVSKSSYPTKAEPERSGFLPGKTRVDPQEKNAAVKTDASASEQKNHPAIADAPLLHEEKSTQSDKTDLPSKDTVAEDKTSRPKEAVLSDGQSSNHTVQPLTSRSLRYISPSMKQATGISQTMSPQYLVETPIIKSQKVVIILKGAGLNKVQSDAILDEIQEDVVIALNPYCSNIKDEVDTLKLFGLDVLVMIPMESLDTNKDQGYLTLRLGMRSDVRDKLLTNIMDVSGTALGIYLDGGGRFLKSEGDVNKVVNFFSDKNKFVVLGEDALNSKFYACADAHHLNYLSVVDTDLDLEKGDQVMGLIRRTGYAALCFDINTPEVVHKINQWIKFLDENNIEVVSLSNLLNKND